MKGGVALALGVMRELAGRPELYAEAAVLLVNDEEWRTVPFAHTERFGGFDACLCFEAGEIDADGHDAVIVKRKAAGTLRGRGATGARRTPARRPRRAAARCSRWPTVAQRIAARSDPDGPDRLTAVPTILRSGEAFNVVPPHGRARLRPARRRPGRLRAGARRRCRRELDDVPIESELVRAWPGMDTRAATADAARGRRARGWGGRGGLRARRRQRRQPHRPGHRRSRSTASGRAAAARTPRTSGWAPTSLRTRAEVALALAAADPPCVTRAAGSLSGALWVRPPTPFAARPCSTATRAPGRSSFRSPAGTCRCSTRASAPSTCRCAPGRAMFDVSHMGEIETSGPDAERFLQRLLSNDVTKLPEGGAQYSVLCREDGGVLDDLFTYRLAGGALPDGHQRRQPREGPRLVSRAGGRASTSRCTTPTPTGRCSPSRGPTARAALARSPTASCRRACAPPSSSWPA